MGLSLREASFGKSHRELDLYLFIQALVANAA